eukprot:8387590-Prorocentrum_lima.AAC.1
MEFVVYKDDLLKKTLLEELSQPALRSTQNLVDLAKVARIMLGDILMRTEEDQSAKASRLVSA